MQKVILANTPLKRMRGLLWRKPLLENELMLIIPCNMIHTFGMKYLIDIVFIDKDGFILKIVCNLNKYKFCICLHAYAVLEFSAGVANKLSLKRFTFLDEKIFSDIYINLKNKKSLRK